METKNQKIQRSKRTNPLYFNFGFENFVTYVPGKSVAANQAFVSRL